MVIGASQASGRRALLVVHDHLSPPGPVEEALRRNGFYVIEHKVVRGPEPSDMPVTLPDFDPAFPDPATFDLVVVLGSVCAVYDQRIAYWVQPEQDMLRAAERAGVPVLGICFGGQLLAAAHGGRVEPAPVAEIGFRQVVSRDESLVPSGPWYEWHTDRWVAPPGATAVAENAAAPQAFLLRRNLAVQFHPEVTTATLSAWMDGGGREMAAAYGFDPDALLAEAAGTDERSCRRATDLVEGFLARVGLRGAGPE